MTKTDTQNGASKMRGGLDGGPPAGPEFMESVNGRAPASKYDGREDGTLPRATREFRFRDQVLRAILLDGQLAFIVGDICAVLGLTSARAAISGLDTDEKGVCEIETAGGRQRANVVNESGLCRLAFNSRKPQAKAFQRWITGELLPQIRDLGGEAKSAPSRQDGNGAVHIAIPRYGRFVVMNCPGSELHVRETALEVTVSEISATDCVALAHHLGLVEAYWQKFQQNNAVGVDPRGGFALGKLEDGILEGGRLGRHFLRCYAMSED